MKSLPLNKDISVPILGFGTWKINGDECVEAVKYALEVGYRHIDTADGYENHREVAKGIKSSGIPRSELFITTKIRPMNLHTETVKENAKRFLEELETDYIDLLLIHWPNKEIPMEETFKAMEDIKKEGIIRTIGVSNFTKRHLNEAMATGAEVVNNQVELHPTFNQKELREYCKSNNITITAYSPLGRSTDLNNSVIVELSEKYSKTPAQIILNWIMQMDVIAIPKSANKDRIKENFDSSDFKIEKEDLEKIDNIKQGERIGRPAHHEFDD